MTKNPNDKNKKDLIDIFNGKDETDKSLDEIFGGIKDDDNTCALGHELVFKDTIKGIKPSIKKLAKERKALLEERDKQRSEILDQIREAAKQDALIHAQVDLLETKMEREVKKHHEGVGDLFEIKLDTDEIIVFEDREHSLPEGLSVAEISVREAMKRDDFPEELREIAEEAVRLSERLRAKEKHNKKKPDLPFKYEL